MEQTAIKVTQVRKVYKLYDTPAARLKDALGLSRKQNYREHEALKGVDLEIKRGETVGIIGTNGSGKSTLLNLICGILRPYQGTVSIRGSIAPLIELGAGFDGNLTGRENIFLNGAVLGHSQKYMREHFEEIIEFAELGEFLDSPIKNYSSGMKARLGFSVATMVHPDILIVDEILAVGDAAFQEKSKKRMLELMGGGTTVLFVSHGLNQVEEMCNRVVWLEHGQVQMEGQAKEVCAAYGQ